MAEQVQSKYHEDPALTQAIEFLRQSFAKKQTGAFWGKITVILDCQAGQITGSELIDSLTLRKQKS